MEILDPDLWNDDGTPKRPSRAYMQRLHEAQMDEALDPATPAKRQAELDDAFLNYARIKKMAREERSPEIGDIVHFFEGDHAACRAAIVMEVEAFSDGANLRVHIPRGPFQDWQADHDEAKGDDTWHWPCGEGQ
jgi:hypothetical protein